MRNKNKVSIPSKYLLTILAILCIVLMFLSYSTGFNGGPLNVAANYIFVPMQKSIDFVGNFISLSNSDYRTREELEEENAKLQERVDELNNRLNTNMIKQNELEELEQLLELKNTYFDYKTTGARVIAKDTSNWFDTFTIDKGSNDGIKVDMNVMASGGLVGIVTEVGPNYSVVRAIIDDSSSVSATISTTMDNCIVSGSLTDMTDSNMIGFSNLYDSNNLVAIGDSVVTSHISSKYMPGILIGYVSEISSDTNDLTKSGKITPAADFKHLNDVLIVLDVKENYVNGN